MNAQALKPSTLQLESLWQAEGNALKPAALEFARGYWAQPRKVRDFATHADGSATFSVAGGSRTYVATFAKGTFGPIVVVSYVAL